MFSVFVVFLRYSQLWLTSSRCTRVHVHGSAVFMVHKVHKVHMHKVQVVVRVFPAARAPKKPTAGGAHSLTVLKVHN